MSDVVVKLITGNDMSNGSAILSARQTGGYDEIAPGINKTQTTGEFVSQLGNRFDDTTYYTS